ncbi:MAG: lytic murein transglycosylase [Candidatus Pacebacteria bacterium]|nr:lytic murein transglycosylase [Candidatus Paceibacterota bacterium]
MAKKTIVFIFIFSIMLITAGYLAIPKAFAVDCLNITPSSSNSDKDYCRNELTQIENQLAELIAKQKEQQKQTGTLKGDVDYLTSQINALKTKIKARALVIAQLKVSITEKSKQIGSLNAKIEREHESIAQLIRNTNEFDNANILHVVLGDESISDFYSDLESYSTIKEAVKVSVDNIKGIKSDTEVAKKDLEAKQDAETDAKAELESAQKKVAQSEADKKKLLQISKNQEAAYQKLAAEKKAQADKIRSALFSLAGISQKIEFGTALLYANDVSKKTGVDPAFLLAILTQESNLGSNVGQCYLTDSTGPNIGYGKNIKTGKVWTNLMKPTRDVEPFLAITSRLNLNPYNTAVSCPIAGVAGYGGAMGPAQFIPSTWQLFASRLKAILGYEANPWAPKDAFMASGMYLTDLGAVGTSESAQKKAACRYYGSGGSSCSYGNSVAKLRATIQANIDLLSS